MSDAWIAARPSALLDLVDHRRRSSAAPPRGSPRAPSRARARRCAPRAAGRSPRRRGTAPVPRASGRRSGRAGRRRPPPTPPRPARSRPSPQVGRRRRAAGTSRWRDAVDLVHHADRGRPLAAGDLVLVHEGVAAADAPRRRRPHAAPGRRPSTASPTRSFSRAPSSVRGLWNPGVSVNTTWTSLGGPDRVDVAPRRLGLVGDDRDLRPDQRVHERRLADVRPPDDGDEPAAEGPSVIASGGEVARPESVGQQVLERPDTRASTRRPTRRPRSRPGPRTPTAPVGTPRREASAFRRRSRPRPPGCPRRARVDVMRRRRSARRRPRPGRTRSRCSGR